MCGSALGVIWGYLKVMRDLGFSIWECSTNDLGVSGDDVGVLSAPERVDRRPKQCVEGQDREQAEDDLVREPAPDPLAAYLTRAAIFEQHRPNLREVTRCDDAVDGGDGADLSRSTLQQQVERRAQ